MLKKLNEGLEIAEFNRNMHTKEWTDNYKKHKEKEPDIEKFSLSLQRSFQNPITKVNQPFDYNKLVD